MLPVALVCERPVGEQQVSHFTGFKIGVAVADVDDVVALIAVLFDDQSFRIALALVAWPHVPVLIGDAVLGEVGIHRIDRNPGA